MAVPMSAGLALFEAAAEPKQLLIIPKATHLTTFSYVYPRPTSNPTCN